MRCEAGSPKILEIDYSRAPCLGADQKARGFWERDWLFWQRIYILLRIGPCACSDWSKPMFYPSLYNNQINARALIGQSAMVYCAVNSWKNRASSELLYKSKRPQVSMVYTLVNHLACWKNTRRIRKAARDLRILLVFYQHPAWFISL